LVLDGVARAVGASLGGAGSPLQALAELFGEAQLTAQIRQALGDDPFGQVFAAGSRLSQQEAVAAIRDRPGSRAQPA
jgi:hypothetical protein